MPDNIIQFPIKKVNGHEPTDHPDDDLGGFFTLMLSGNGTEIVQDVWFKDNVMAQILADELVSVLERVKDIFEVDND